MKRFFTKENTIGLLLLLTAVAAFCCLEVWRIFSGGKENAAGPEPVPISGWQEREFVLSGGGVCRISGKAAYLYGADGDLKWSTDEAVSEKALLVQDGLVADLDGDGARELVLLLWKVGKYGRHKPFWEGDEENGQGSGEYSQHIFIYSISPEYEVKEKWCASDVGREITRFKMMEKNNTILLTEDVTGQCSLWRWESFGLKNMENGATLVAFGDNIIHKEIYEYANAKLGGKYDFLYEPFYEDIQGADIAVFQQETMLVDKESAVGGYPMFGSPLAVGEAIVEAGFDVACCAGNHALDRGSYGVDVTAKFYKENGVLPVGIQESEDKDYRPFEIVNRNGISFALLDYTYGTGVPIGDEMSPTLVHYLPEESDRDSRAAELLQDVKAAGENADLVVVFVHWGEEYSKEISEYQRWITKLLAEGGADLVIGTHPHVLQDVEQVERPDGGKMLVYYSLGNFRAYQGQSEDTRTGGEAVVRAEHCYEGVRITTHELKKIDAFVRLE